MPNSDAVDMLLGLGMSHEDIVGFILGVIFAGVINTGINGTLPHYPHLTLPGPKF